MEVSYRDYTDKDKEKLLELTKKLGAFTKKIDPLKRIVNAAGFFEKDLDETLENVANYQGKILLAEDKGSIIGFIIGVIREQSEKNKLEIGHHTLGEVLDLFIEEEFRSHGIGSTMLSHMEQYFKEKGCDSMWVHLFAPNKNAHAVYEKCGFTDRSIGMLKNI